MKPSKVRVLALVSLVLGALLLVWPSTPGVALWDLPGMAGGGTFSGEVASPFTFLIGGRPLVDGWDRLQLSAGLVLVGVSIGAGLAVRTRVPKPSRKRPTGLSGHQALRN